METDTFLLNALVGRGDSLELRTQVYSPGGLDSLLEDDPMAITLSPEGALSGEQLLRAAAESLLFHKRTLTLTKIRRWRYYTQASGQERLEFKGSVVQRDIVNLKRDFSRGIAVTQGSIAAWIPENPWLTEHEEEVRRVLSVGLRRSAAALRRRGAAQASDDSSSERDAVNRARKELLDQVGAYTSEDLAAAGDSTTRNPSQYAADQRRAGKVFGVRLGVSWLYPKFQFDEHRHVLAQMKPILSALSPDPRGWDRLQWFLEPHEVLRGRRPLDVWTSDRDKVIEAANRERWNGRD